MKILIGCPTYKRYTYCINHWLNAVKKIQNFSPEHQIDYLLADNSDSDEFFHELKNKGVNIIKTPYFSEAKKRMIYARNLLRNKALEGNYDYFFSLEQDMFPEKDVLNKLLNHKKEIISAYYGKLVNLTLVEKETREIKKITIEIPIVWLQQENGVKRANPHEVLNKGVITVGGFGVGCLLINREVLEKIEFEYAPDKKAFDDLLFCKKAKDLNYKLYLDSDIRVIHLHKPWKEDNITN